MEELDFTKEPWKDIQFRVKTLEELEEFYGRKLTNAFQGKSSGVTYVQEMFRFMGKSFTMTSEVLRVWMGLKNWTEIKEFYGYSFIKEWITHNKINDDD